MVGELVAYATGSTAKGYEDRSITIFDSPITRGINEHVGGGEPLVPRGIRMTRNANIMPVFSVSYNKVGFIHVEYYPDFIDAMKAFNGYKTTICGNKKCAWHLNLKLQKCEIDLPNDFTFSSKQCLTDYLNSGQCEALKNC